METNLTIKRNKPLDVVVDEINKIVEWWMDNYKKSTIDQLIDMRAKLTTYLFTFATYIGETKEEQLASETRFKIKHHQERKKNLEANYTIAKAEDEAVLATKEERERVSNFEGYYIKLRLMLDQANKIDDAIQQKIGILRREKETANA